MLKLLLEVAFIIVQKFFSSLNLSLRKDDDFELFIDHTFDRAAVELFAGIDKLYKGNMFKSADLKIIVQVHIHVFAFEQYCLIDWPDVTPILANEHMLVYILNGH